MKQPTQPHSILMTCPSCGELRNPDIMQSGLSLPTKFQKQLQLENPDWNANMDVCESCVRNVKADVAESILEADGDELSELEREVVDSFRDGEIMPMNANEEDMRERSVSEIYADKLADIVGSWRFSFGIVSFIILWCGFSFVTGIIQTNIMITLGVISATLGSLAAIQGPIILMSQRRVAKRDRIRAENDYRVNLKAELEITMLNDKLDHIIHLQLDNIRRIEQLEAQTNVSANQDDHL